METTIIKIGNSLGSRYSKAYLDKIGVKEGDKVTITLKKKAKPDRKKAIQALRDLAAMNGSLSKIDVEKWEVERKAAYEKRDAEFRDILGR